MKTFFTCCILFLGFNCFSQESTKRIISLHFTTGSNDLTRGDELIGGPSYHGKGFNGFGIQYSKSLLKWLAFETGFEYMKNKIDIVPGPNPNIDRTPKRESLELMSIPLYLRVDFLRYLFINGGFSLDMETQNNFSDDQSGIGFALGAGVKYAFKPGITLIVNPLIQQHAFLPFTKEEYQQRLLNSGIKFGIGYTF